MMSSSRRFGVAGAIGAIIGLVVMSVPASAAPTTRRVSVKSSGAQAGAIGEHSGDPTVSATGRFIAFESEKSDLVANDTNTSEDVFLHDKSTGKVTRISVRSNEGEALNGDSNDASISANGRWIAFESDADNLVTGDTNGQSDVFVRDRVAGTTKRISVKSNGAQVTDNDSTNPAISADGRFITFESQSETLVPNDTNAVQDIFVHDRSTGKTRRVNLRSNGAQALLEDSEDPAISATGRFVVFETDAANLVTGDSNGFVDVFVHDRSTRQTRRVSVKSNGAQATGGHSDTPSISGSGRFVAFESGATNLDSNGFIDVFVFDRDTTTLKRMSVHTNGTASNGDSLNPRISTNGRMVVFVSNATNLSGSDNDNVLDVYVRDRNTSKTRLLSLSSTGVKGDGESSDARVSGDGRFAAWGSAATNLVANDTNDVTDVFLRGPLF